MGKQDYTLVTAKSGRIFVVTEQEDGKVFIGSPAELSRIASQLCVHAAVKPLGMKPTKAFRDVIVDSKLCVAVGFYLDRPGFHPFRKRYTLKDLVKALEAYQPS